MSRDNAFTPKSLTAPDYVRALFEPSDSAAIFARNRATGKVVQRIARAEAIASPEFQEWLAAQSAAEADIYISMNPLKEGAYNRTKESIKEIRHAYLDLDNNGDASLDAIRNSTEVPAPNFVLDTSPGKHQVVWKVTGFSAHEAEGLLRALSDQFDGDRAATDSTRVLRLPGFANRKVSGGFVVQARHESNGVYRARDFALQEDSPETPRQAASHHERCCAMPADYTSQSERDWAYAKRALARGDDPRDVARRIANYRAADKSDPKYYARHTVMKAAAQLEQERGNRGPSTFFDSSPSGKG